MDISPEIISLIEEIKNDKTHGASELARRASGVLKTAAEHSKADSAEAFLHEQREIGEKLISAWPAMAPIFNVVSRLLNSIAKKESADLTSVRLLVVSQTDKAIRDSEQAVARIARYGAGLIADSDTIMTHSYSSTVMAALKEAMKMRRFQMIITRSGPGHSGESIARQLGLLGVTVTLIDDTAVGLYVSQVNKVLAGADRVCTDGGVVNGIGTYPLAIVAKRAGVAFYVLCETLKFDPRLSSKEVDLEEKDPSEIVESGKLPPTVRIKNPHFDITPLELITGVITESGLLRPEAILNLARGQARP